LNMAVADRQVPMPETVVKADLSTTGYGPRWLNMAVADRQVPMPETVVKADLSTTGYGPRWLNMAVADRQVSTPTASEGGDKIDTSQWASLNHFPLHHKNYSESLQDTVLLLNSTEGFHKFWKSENKFGRVPVVTNRSLLDERIKLLGVVDIPWHNVLMVCHENHGGACHLPLRTQRFFVAASLFADGHVENLMFTEHMMNPDCDPECNFMHHVVEYALLRGNPLLQDTEQFLV